MPTGWGGLGLSPCTDISGWNRLYFGVSGDQAFTVGLTSHRGFLPMHPDIAPTATEPRSDTPTTSKTV